MTTKHVQPVGKVFIVYGTVKAISTAGVERILTPNSLVYADERIVTGPDGNASIVLTGNNSRLDLGRMSDVLIDQDVYGGSDHEANSDVIAQVADIQAALEDGSIDPTTGLPAPAAGPDVAGTAGDRGGGRQIVVFDADNMEILPDSGAETTGIILDFLDPPPGGIDEGDDAPTVFFNDLVQLDDDALSGGNAGGTGDDADALNVSGTLAHSYGADGSGSIAYLTAGAPTGFSYESGAGGSLLIKQGGATVLTLTLDSAGKYTVTQNASIDHSSGDLENNVEFTIGYRVTDGDGDFADGTLKINVDDDTPTVAVNDLVRLDDDTLGGNAGGMGDDDDAVNVSGTLSHSFGADGGSISWLTTGGLPSGFSYGTDSSGNLVINQGGTKVLTLTLNSVTGAYEVTQNASIDHPSGDYENNVEFTIGYRVTDGDGDFADGTLKINVDDDTPVVLIPKGIEGRVYEDGLPGGIGGGQTAVTYSLDSAFVHHVGADAPAIYSLVSPDPGFATGLTSNGSPVSYSVTGNTLFATSDDGRDIFTLKLDNSTSGTVTFTLLDHLDHTTLLGNPDFTTVLIKNLGQFVQMEDSDHDAVNFANGLLIYVQNDVPTVTDGQDSMLSNEAGNHVSGHLDFQTGADDPVSVQLGRVDGTTFTALSGAVRDTNGDHLTSGGHDLTWQNNGNGSWSAVFDDGNSTTSDVVFTVTVDVSLKTYSVVLDNLNQLDNINNVDQTINLAYRVVDADGDKSNTADFTIIFNNDRILDARSSSSGVSIAGGDGDDVIAGGDGDDVIDGGDGDDYIFDGDGDDVINGGDGRDVIRDSDGDDVINGGDGDDIINDGDGDDVINGGDGNDEINGGAGADIISGGDGADVINGGDGEDEIDGGPGTDDIHGGSGSDTFLQAEWSNSEVHDYNASELDQLIGPGSTP